jgi:glutamyl-tRNA synthetase
MSSSGALFDLVKLIDVSKNTLANLSAEELYYLALNWSVEFDKPFYELLSQNKEYALKILSIGRGGPKPRKDIALLSEIKNHIAYMYDVLFEPKYEYPAHLLKDDILDILRKYKEIYNENEENDVWFGKIKELSEGVGFAGETKAYKKNPELYKGSVGDVSMVLRVAVTGRTNSLDMFEVMRILGRHRVQKRLDDAIKRVD